MVTGINSDVRHGDRVYHVQTQDLGIERAVIESLVFVGGQVFDAVEGSYQDLARAEPESIRKRLIAQHLAVIASVSEGKYAEPAAKGPAPPAATRELPDLVVTEIEDCRVGQTGSLMILLRGKVSYQPIPRAEVEVFFPPILDAAHLIHADRTDSRGFHLAAFRIPHTRSPQDSLLVRTTCPTGSAQARVKVFATGGAPSRDPQLSAAAAPSATAEPAADERPNLVVSELHRPRAGRPVSFLILLQEEGSQRPIGEARLCALHKTEGREPETIYEAATDARGFHLAEFTIPAGQEGRTTLIIQATCVLGVAEVVLPILP